MTQEHVAGRSSALHKTREISFDTAQIHAFSQIRSCQTLSLSPIGVTTCHVDG